MKRTVFSTVMILVIILLVSCGQNLDPQLNRLDELKIQYDNVGSQHNSELNGMLNVYNNYTGITSYANCCDLADEHFSHIATGVVAGQVMDLLGDFRYFAKPCINEEIIDLLADSINIISTYPEVFDSISVILDSPIGIEAKKTLLETVYLYADEKIEDADDKESVMNGISTTIHSLEYWDENYTEWQNTLTGAFAKPSLGIIGAIGIIDGVGAVIGTLEGIRDTYRGQEGRVRIIAGRAIGEAAKTSTYAVLALVLL